MREGIPPNRWKAVAVLALAVASLAARAEPPAPAPWRPPAWHPPFPGEARRLPHVEAASRTLDGYPWLDGQWQGMRADSAGDIWFGVSCHDGVHAGQLFRYRPAAGRLEHIADLGAAVGETDPAAGDGVPEGKIHSEIFEDGNTLYCATTDAHALHAREYSGGYWLAVDRTTGAVTNLGFSLARDGLLCAGYDPRRKRLYGHTNVKGLLVEFDPATRTEKIIGVPWQPYLDAWKADPDPAKPRQIWPRGLALMVAPDSRVYGARPPGCAFWCYDPEKGTLGDAPVAVPVPAEVAAGDKAAAERWQRSALHAARWNEKDGCFYVIRSYDESLCRFFPPADGKPGRLEPVAPLGLPGPHRYGTRHPSCGLVIAGRKAWYAPYTGWGGTASLVSADLDTGRVVHHGPLVTDGGRQVAECHSMAAGADGRLYLVAFVYSKEGQDPAQEHGMRDKYPFHPRLLVVDPAKDLKVPASGEPGKE